MIVPMLLALLAVAFLMLGIGLLRNGLRQAQTDRVLERLAQGQPQSIKDNAVATSLERTFIRAGLGRPTERLGLWLTLWAVGALLGGLLGQWIGLFVMVVTPPLALRLYIAVRYRRRLRRMIEQLPQLLDHAVRSRRR